MRWIRAIHRWGTLVVAVTAVAGTSIAGKQWAERHYLASLLGPQAASSGVELYLRHSVACAKDIHIPLALSEAPDPTQTAELSAAQLWFSFDTQAFLQKRIVLPSVAGKNTRIKASPVHFATAKQLASTESAHAWLQQLHAISETLQQEDFISRTQVCTDCDLMIDHWREGFASVLSRSQQLLADAQDQRQQLMAIVNPLREEKRIALSIQRLDQINQELDSLIADLAKSDKPLREQQSSLREAMLREKNNIVAKGAAFSAPPADGLAQHIIRRWIELRIHQSVQYTQLLAQLLVQPFHDDTNNNGEDIRHAEYPQPDVSISIAKLAGEIETPLSTAPFKATGRLAIMPKQTISGSLPCGDSAGWEFQINEGDQHYLLKGRMLNARAGQSQIQLFAANESNSEELSLQCAYDRAEARGSGQMSLGGDAPKTGVLPNFPDINARTHAAKLWNSYLSQNPSVPSKIYFQIAGSNDAFHVAIDAQAYDWLAEGLSQQASKQLEQLHLEAADKLEQRVREKLDTMSHQLAVSKEETLLGLKQSRQELELVKEEIMRQLADWSRGQFAGQNNGSTVR